MQIWLTEGRWQEYHHKANKCNKKNNDPPTSHYVTLRPLTYASKRVFYWISVLFFVMDIYYAAQVSNHVTYLETRKLLCAKYYCTHMAIQVWCFQVRSMFWVSNFWVVWEMTPVKKFDIKRWCNLWCIAH